MTPELRALHLAHRQKASLEIRSSPASYKVCRICLSIAWKQAPLCPICHAHGFYESEQAVWVVATLTEKVAFPKTAGTVPRLQLTE
jgi:RNA polymerase subunit RPABC4/transcription elongation factor Spt4